MNWRRAELIRTEVRRAPLETVGNSRIDVKCAASRRRLRLRACAERDRLRQRAFAIGNADTIGIAQRELHLVLGVLREVEEAAGNAFGAV
jgi:hypothetical protein